MDVLTQIEQAITGLVHPKDTQTVEALVINGKRLLYDKESSAKLFNDMANMQAQSDPQQVALSVAGLMTLMREEQDIPDRALVPSASLLLSEVIQFMEAAEMLKPDTEFVGNAYEELFSILMQKLEIGPQDLDQLDAQAQSINPNPHGVVNEAQMPEQMPEQMPQQMPQQGVIAGAMQ